MLYNELPSCHRSPHRPLTLARTARVGWPLAARRPSDAPSCLRSARSSPVCPNPEVNLAAYVRVVFPLALIIESPIIMLLASSTALCKDWASYRQLYRFMMIAGAALTGLHVLIAFTPLYYVVVQEIGPASRRSSSNPARIGLMIMTPWTWAIAYRRFQRAS